MKRYFAAFAFLAICVVSAAACSGAPSQSGAASQPTAGSSGASSAPTAGPSGGGAGPTPVAEATSALPTSGASGSESLSVESRAAGLDKLKSYRIRWQSQWNSTENGQAKTASWDWLEEYASNPEALHWNWKYTDVSANNPGAMELWQIGDTTYMVTTDNNGKASCVSFSTQDSSQRLGKGMFSPSSLGSVSNARFVGLDNTNGISTKHYTYDSKGISLAGIGQVSGDMWVAADGGYVVKDVMKWQGGAGMFGLGATGTGQGQWTWELTDANQVITIKAPDNCGGAAGDVPIMADAKEKTTLGDMVTYKSASPLAAVVDFYQKQMVAAGWKLDGEPLTSDAFTQLNFTRGDKKAQVTITSEQNVSSVIVNVSGP